MDVAADDFNLEPPRNNSSTIDGYCIQTDGGLDLRECRVAFAILVAIIVFIWLRLTSARRRERVEIARMTGMIRSPLYHAQAVLLLALIALTIWAGHVHESGGGLPRVLLGGIAADVIALLLVRRALKWRYPV